jgi:predicted alpha/beta-fold hydrolase
MPFTEINYKGGLWSLNGHVETIARAYAPVVKFAPTTKEILTLNDGDFIELEWYAGSHKVLFILTHGLEGSARSGYIVQLAQFLNLHGYDVLAWCMRGCGAQLNLLPRAYHSGETDDLDQIVTHALKAGYQQIVLVGFSLGGNITVKYMGEKAEIRPQIVAGFAISAPLDLQSAAEQLVKSRNFIYHKYFLTKLTNKLKLKAERFPELKPLLKKQIKTLIDFDDVYTGPIHGFAGANDYYAKNSGTRFLQSTNKPTFILNAINDPLLTPECFPVTLAEQHKFVHLLSLKKGGHVAFSMDIRLRQMFHIEWILLKIKELL